MQVHELIAKLRLCYAHAEVFVWTPEGERIPVTSVDPWDDDDDTAAPSAVDINCGED